MSIQYVCRHCHNSLGELPEGADQDPRLGLQFLTPDERNDIITYNQSGELVVKLTCEYCEEALQEHPELSLLGNLLQ